MRGQVVMRGYVWLLGLLLLTLACTLTVLDDEAAPTDSDEPLVDDFSGPPPTVQIVSPASGQQVRLGDDVEIRVVANDQRGVNRLQLSVSGRTSSTKSFPEPSISAEALLRWRPDREGVFELSVVAFRQAVPSSPVMINLEVVGRGDPISNPASGQTDVAAAPPAGECVGRVLINNLRIRTGPGTNFQHEGNFDLNERLTAIGKNADNGWVKVRRLDGAERWVINNAEWIEISGDCAALPVVNE